MRIELFMATAAQWLPSFALVLLAGCASTPKPVSAITVRDSNFDVVQVLDTGEIAEFQRLWQTKSLVDAPFDESKGRHFKLDLRRGTPQERWLYMTTGHVRLLAMVHTPVYKVSEVQAFNRLIGATP